MTVKTDRGKTFDVNYAWGPVRSTGELMIELTVDARPLSQIAADFEGVQAFEREDENEGNMTFVGYTELVSVVRDRNTGAVLLALRRGNNG